MNYKTNKHYSRARIHTHTQTLTHTQTNIKTRFKNYDTYQEPLSEEWINGRSRNHLAYTIVRSVVKLPTKLQDPILWVGLINKETPIKSLPKCKVGLDTISRSYSVDCINSNRNILD